MCVKLHIFILFFLQKQQVFAQRVTYTIALPTDTFDNLLNGSPYKYGLQNVFWINQNGAAERSSSH